MTRRDDQIEDGQIGRLTKLARGSIATLVEFRHHDVPHRDPHDEVFDFPTIIFTLQGYWHIRSLNERAIVDPDTVVYGRAGQHYRCRHDEEIPRDRNMALDFNREILREIACAIPCRRRAESSRSTSFWTDTSPCSTSGDRLAEGGLADGGSPEG